MMKKELLTKLSKLSEENREIFLADMESTFEERLDQFIKLTVK